MNADGWVTIGFKGDTKQLERDLRKEEQELRKFEKEAEKLATAKLKAEADLEEYEKEKQAIQETTNKLLEQAQTSEQVEAILEMENSQLEELNEKYSKQINRLEEVNKKIQENADNQERAKENVKQMNEELKKAKGFEKMKSSVESVGKSVEEVTKKIGKMALAVFAVRSAYMFIRNAISTIADNDAQLKADIDYMKNALAYTLEPVVKSIVNLMKQLMFYVAYVVKAWTGKNIFENANKSLKGANKQAKQLSKTLAGFDEMNILSDTSGGGDTGVATPSFDLSQIEGDVPEWIKWIADNKDIVIAGLLGIAVGLTAIKLGLNPIMALGIGVTLAGIVLLIQDIIKFIKDPSLDNFLNILRDLEIVLIGISIIMIAINASNPIGWIMLLISIIALLITEIIKHWDTVKEVLGKVGNWIYDHIIKPISDFFAWLWENIKNGVSSAVNWVKEKFKSIVDFFSNLISKIVNLFKTIGTKVGDAIGGAFKAVINSVLGAIENILNFPIKSINKLISVINKVPGINLGKLTTFDLPRLARGGIVNNPGPGVMMGSYIAGERGPEAVIPLDDLTLDRLGEAFARHTQINASIPVYVGNRQIVRELKKINAEDDFAYNA